MIKALIFFLIIVAGIILGPALVGHQGMVLIQTDQYDITTSITALVIGIIIFYLVLWIIIKCISLLLRSGSFTFLWLKQRKSRRAERQTYLGLIKFIEGDYRKAYSLFSRSASAAKYPFLNNLFAAHSAQYKGDILHANEQLELAQQCAATHQFTVDIVTLQMQIGQNHFDDAYNTLCPLLLKQPKHPQLLYLAEQVFTKTEHFQELLDIVPQMRKVGLYSDSQVDEVEQNAYLGLIRSLAEKEGGESLYKWWKDQHKVLKHTPQLQICIAKTFIQLADDAHAQEIIIAGNKLAIIPELIELIEQLKLVNPDELESLLRKMLNKTPNSALLNRTLGILFYKEGKWQLATQHLQHAVDTAPDPKIYALLAESFDKLNLLEQANHMRQQCLTELLH